MNTEISALQWYQENLKKFSGTGEQKLKAVGWYGKEAAEARYLILRKVVLEQGVKSNRLWTMLDVGCGFGELYRWLNVSLTQMRYTGLDIMPEFIEGARRLTPHANWFCEPMSKLSEFRKAGKIFDVTVANGTFNHRSEPNHCLSTDNDFYWSVMQEMWRMTKQAMIITFASAEYKDHTPDTLAWYPEDVLGKMMGFSKRLILRHDYLPNDFLVVVRKDEENPWS